ncbi:20176_t:CDS:1, partial [Dentiscutata erythropus]
MINNDDKPELITQDDTEDDTEELDEIMVEKNDIAIEEHDDMLIDGNMTYNKLMTNGIISDLDGQKGKCVEKAPAIDQKQRKHNYHVSWGENVTLLV